MKRSNGKKRSSFTARRGLVLSLSIGAFVALIFVLVYYVYDSADAEIIRIIGGLRFIHVAVRFVFRNWRGHRVSRLYVAICGVRSSGESLGAGFIVGVALSAHRCISKSFPPPCRGACGPDRLPPDVVLLRSGNRELREGAVAQADAGF